MFDNPAEEKGGSEGLVPVQLFHKSDGTNAPPKADPQDVSTKPIAEAFPDVEVTPPL